MVDINRKTNEKGGIEPKDVIFTKEQSVMAEIKKSILRHANTR